MILLLPFKVSKTQNIEKAFNFLLLKFFHVHNQLQYHEFLIYCNAVTEELKVNHFDFVKILNSEHP